jgi:hypothetical protein
VPVIPENKDTTTNWQTIAVSYQTEKHITDAAMSSFEDDNEVRRREGKNRRFLKTFEELKSMCADIDGQIDDVNGSERGSRCYSVDYMSETYVPRSLSERGDVPIDFSSSNVLHFCNDFRNLLYFPSLLLTSLSSSSDDIAASVICFSV